MGLLQAILDAIQGEDERIGGQKLTRLTSPLPAASAGPMNVETTYGFGEYDDGTTNGRVLLGGEIIRFATRTPTQFVGLSRGESASTVRTHETSALVFDYAGNESAIDLVRRGLLVEFAIGEDLDIIARNLGLPKCPGLTDMQWRAVIKATAYLAKQPIDAFNQAFTALLGLGNFRVFERPTDPWRVFISVAVILATSLRGRFVLNGGEPAIANFLGTQVTVLNPINHVLGAYDDNFISRRGERIGVGLTNFATTNTFAGSTITLDIPVAPFAQLIVDYGAWKAHYLAPNETVRDDGDYYAYLADPLLTAQCLADHIRAAGIKVVVSALL